MIVTYFRSSSYNGYNMCEQQFFIEYTLGWRFPSGKKAEKGTIMHRVLEVMAVAKKAQQDGKKTFKDDICGRVSVGKYNLDNITKKCYDHYVSHSVHDWEPSDLKDCRTWVQTTIELHDGQYNPATQDIVEAEAHFDFEIDKPWAKYDYDLPNGEKLEGKLALKGTMDLVTQESEDCYMITDYKSGQRKDWATGEVKTYEKLCVDPQLRMYYYAAKQLYPNIKTLLVTILYTNDGGPFTICFTEDDIPAIEKMIHSKFEEVQKNTKPKLLTGYETWKCKYLCPFSKNTFEGTNVVPILGRDGKPLSICQQTKHALEYRSMDKVMEHMSAPNHDVGFYQAPGEVK